MSHLRGIALDQRLFKFHFPFFPSAHQFPEAREIHIDVSFVSPQTHLPLLSAPLPVSFLLPVLTVALSSLFDLHIATCLSCDTHTLK